MALYEYQRKIIEGARALHAKHKHFAIQAPTGSGKTYIFTEMAKRMIARHCRVWAMAPRNILIDQASEHFYNAGIPHGRIASNGAESSAFKAHVVSKDTLIRRYDKIKKHPDYIFVDECHIALDRQIEIASKFPNTRLIGFTATPERSDGRGLGGDAGLYGDYVRGPQLKELVELGFLSNPLYYAPPLDGLDGLRTKGTEYNAGDLEELFAQRKVYGKAIEHYRTLANNKTCIVFTRSVKAAEDTAKHFRDAGYRFESIDGTMGKRERAARLNGLRDGTLHGLTSADLLTYGVDIKNVECIIMLRPTMSTALFFQIVGRGLRALDGKESCVILDHVNNLYRHGHPLDFKEWNFFGTEKKKAKTDDKIKMRICPDTFLYCTKPTCRNCYNNKTGRESRAEELIDIELKEVDPGIKFNQRDPEERKVFADKISRAVESGKIADLLDIAQVLGRPPLWAYHKMSEGRLSVNVTLLHEIRRIKGYKKGWVWMQKKQLEHKKKNTAKQDFLNLGRG